MTMYMHLGDVPPKRHTQLWRDGRLLTEQVVGLKGFSGRSSILYHLNTPVRVKEVGKFSPLAREVWRPDTHVHRHFATSGVAAEGDPISGRKVLLFNQDIEVALARPSEAMEYYYRNGEGDEVVFVHEGSGTLESQLGEVPYRAGDYVVIPRGITYRFVMDDAPQRHLVFVSPGVIEIPRDYRNEYGQLLEHAPFYNRDLHGPTRLQTNDEAGEFLVRVRIRDGHQDYVLDHHPFDVVGWDGYLYPYTLNLRDFEPITKSIHAPPPVHQTFEGQNFVLCSFCPRPLDWHPQAVPIPYAHANVNSEELLYYVEGNFSSRKGVEVGSITLHPSGVPHGPQPGLAERAIGAEHTDEYAVMCDTFHPLHLTTQARDLERPDYIYSWSERHEPPRS